MKKNTYTRDFTPIERMESEANVLTFSVASPAPYERSDKQHGSYYEVLQISDDAINFERLVDQRCPFLYEHDTDKQIGVVERAWIENEKLYVQVRFSENFEAQEVVSDIITGIRRNCSIRLLCR
jgi:hypothetical protein